MNTLPNPILYAIPFFLFSLLFEGWWLKRHPTRRRCGVHCRDSVTSVAMGLGYLLTNLLMVGVVLQLTKWIYSLRLIDIPMSAATYVVLIFGEDFVYYWFHRLSHEHRIWWAAHVNHHSSEYYNLSTALRQSWTVMFSLGWTPWLVLVFIGFPPEFVFFQAGINLLYQYWIHTEMIQKLPRWFEVFFNTPSHHRVHHATQPVYLDRNYGGIFIIWDRLFGTFEAERISLPCRYGIVKNIRTFNLLEVAFHEWKSLWQDLRTAPNIASCLRYIFGRPGWSHKGPSFTSADLRALEAQKGEKAQSRPATTP